MRVEIYLLMVRSCSPSKVANSASVFYLIPNLGIDISFLMLALFSQCFRYPIWNLNVCTHRSLMNYHLSILNHLGCFLQFY